MKPNPKYPIATAVLACCLMACSFNWQAAPALVTATPVPTETLPGLDLPINTLDDFRRSAGAWAAHETENYMVGILSYPISVLYEGGDSYFLAVAIYRKNALAPQVPPLLIGEQGSEATLILDNGHTYHPRLIQTSACWPHFADTERIWRHLNVVSLCGLGTNDPGVPGMTGLGWTFPLEDGETGSVSSVTFKVEDLGVLLFSTIP